jgi:hypothetical protein
MRAFRNAVRTCNYSINQVLSQPLLGVCAVAQ